jgi:methylase of polypeptide subunit release factors
MNAEMSNYKPALAFGGGMIVVKLIHKLISEASKFLTTSGWLVFEVGVEQGSFITRSSKRSQFFKKNETFFDDSGNIRVIAVQKN